MSLKKLLRIKWILFIAFLFVAILGLVYIPAFFQKELYKEMIIEEIRNSSGLELEISSSNLFIFPVPGVVFQKVHLYDPSDIRNFEIKCQKLILDISWLGIWQGKIDFRDAEILNGSIQIRRNKDGNLPFLTHLTRKEEKPVTTAKESESPSIRIQLKEFTIRNSTLTWIDEKHRRTYNAYIWKADGHTPLIGHKAYFSMIGKLDQQPIQFYANVDTRIKSTHFDDFEFDSRVVLNSFSLSAFREPLAFFPKGDFSSTLVSGTIALRKNSGKALEGDFDLRVKNLAYKGEEPFGDISLKTKAVFAVKKKAIQFNDIHAEWKGIGKASGYGNVHWGDEVGTYFNVQGEYGTYDPINKVARLFIPLAKDKPKRFGTYIFDFDIHNVYLFSHHVDSAKGRAVYHKPYLTFYDIRAKMYNGNVQFSAKSDVIDDKDLTVDAKIDGMNAEKLIAVYTPKKYIKGELKSEFHIKSKFQEFKDMWKNMTGEGKFLVTKGELVEYADILRPVAFVGKILNFSWNKKSTDFESLAGNFKIKNNRINLDDVELDGVGVNANADGYVGFDKSIDLKVSISLGVNLVGRVIKIPILYTGVFAKNTPYVDPIWLSTAIGSAMFLAGPLGTTATVGAMAGSAASDYVRDAWEGIKSIFVSDD